MERRRPPRAARGGERRDKGLLCRLQGRYREAGPRSRAGLRVPGRADALSRASAWRAKRRAAADCFCRVHSEPRPGRQPGFRRSGDGFRAGRGSTRNSGGLSAAAADPDAVHGRGMGRSAAFSLLLRFRTRAGRCSSQRSPRGVCAFPGISESGHARAHPRPHDRGNLRLSKARLDEHRPGPAFRVVGLVSPVAGNTAR